MTQICPGMRHRWYVALGAYDHLETACESLIGFTFVIKIIVRYKLPMIFSRLL